MLAEDLLISNLQSALLRILILDIEHFDSSRNLSCFCLYYASHLTVQDDFGIPIFGFWNRKWKCFIPKFSTSQSLNMSCRICNIFIFLFEFLNFVDLTMFFRC
uniref:Uncharacterized protein n=1 Tax=Rhizophagus irregularis (strain DAOM 181602 / DAOM 197198 / MUCL 43194) TaxID=747089 RepID=U9SH44_RHIID